MPENNQDRDRLVYFMGQVVASYTHEIRNILAIISESNGLALDLLALNKAQGTYQEKLNNSLNTVEEQVRRGEELSSYLNTFAHLPDNEEIDIDLNLYINMLISLCQRMAKRKKISLTWKEPNQKIMFRNKGVEFVAAIFTGLQGCLNLAVEEIVFQAEEQDNQIKLSLNCQGNIASETENQGLGDKLDTNWLESLAESLNGSYVIEDNPPAFVLQIPKRK